MKYTDEELENLARKEDEKAKSEGFVRRMRKVEDFRFDETQNAYWDTTTGTLLSAQAVNGAISKDDWPSFVDAKGEVKRIKPSQNINDIDSGLTVEGSTWWPGEGKFIYDKVVNARGVLKIEGAVTYNQYVEPDVDKPKSDENPEIWIEHVKKLWPDPVEHEHFFDFAAHMIQFPGEKVNHGIILSGGQGIGKDSALVPLRHGVGEWNTYEIAPEEIESQYNPYVKSVLLVINEVRPQKEDFKAVSFYNQCKTLLAAPPDMLMMRVLYQNPVYIPNVCHVFLTTNSPLQMHVPKEDRRLFVMHSQLDDPKLTKGVFSDDYFQKLHEYFKDDGIKQVVHWLKNRDISNFKPGEPPAMTHGKKLIIDSTDSIRRTAINELLDAYDSHFLNETKPNVIFPQDLIAFCKAHFEVEEQERLIKAVKAKNFHFKMAEEGFELIKNPESREWRSSKFRSRAAYVRETVEKDERLQLVEKELIRRPLTFVERF